MTDRTSKLYRGPQQILVLVVIVAAIYVFLPQIGDFRSSWRLLGHIDIGPAFIALAFTAGTYLAGTGTYCLLAFKRLGYARTLLVQFAASFVNRLLPAGIGALGSNYLYLRHERHNAAQAGSMVAINNILGVIGHSLILAAAFSIFPDGSLTSKLRHGHDPALILKIVLPLALALVIAGAVLGRKRIDAALKDLRKQLSDYAGRPLSLLAALGTSIALTLCNVLCLYFCALALGLHLPIAAVLLVFTLGVGAGSAVPTPGGLGGFEAGLAAGFIAYGFRPSEALAAALLFRLLSYWLPMIAGALAFIAAQRKNLFAAA